MREGEAVSAGNLAAPLLEACVAAAEARRQLSSEGTVILDRLQARLGAIQAHAVTDNDAGPGAAALLSLLDELGGLVGSAGARAGGCTRASRGRRSAPARRDHIQRGAAPDRDRIAFGAARLRSRPGRLGRCTLVADSYPLADSPPRHDVPAAESGRWLARREGRARARRAHTARGRSPWSGRSSAGRWPRWCQSAGDATGPATSEMGSAT